MQSETGFPSSHQLKYYVAFKSRLKLAARAVLSADAGLLVTSAGTSVYHEAHALRHTALNQSYHFSGISRNLEMSGNFAHVRDKSLQGKVREFV